MTMRAYSRNRGPWNPGRELPQARRAGKWRPKLFFRIAKKSFGRHFGGVAYGGHRTPFPPAAAFPGYDVRYPMRSRSMASPYEKNRYLRATAWA